MPPDREQFALRVGDDVLGVGVPDPPDDQPGSDMIDAAAGSEGSERDLGDLGVGHPLPQFLIEDRFRITDRRPRIVRDRADRGGDGAVLPGGDG